MSAPEFDGQPMTKREVLIARSAYDEGYDDGIGDRGCRPPGWREKGAVRYPLPKVTRERVVHDGCGVAFKLVDGVLHWFGVGADRWIAVTEVYAWDAPHMTQSRVEVLADLLANPTEEVEE